MRPNWKLVLIFGALLTCSSSTVPTFLRGTRLDQWRDQARRGQGPNQREANRGSSLPTTSLLRQHRSPDSLSRHGADRRCKISDERFALVVDGNGR